MHAKNLLFSLMLTSAAIAHARSWGDETQTLGRLSDIVEIQCRRYYGIDINAPIERLQQQPMSEVDKLACAYPYAYRKTVTRLAALEKLDPTSSWGKQAYVTLAARVYNFDYLTSTPHDGVTLEIMGLHPDLLILHRILRQLTPYALSFAYPRLTPADADLPMSARVAAAGAAELTPWSATLRQALGTDCYGPGKENCLKNKSSALRNLLQAIHILSQNQNLYGYVTGYSATREATALQSAPLIRIASDVQKSISGQLVDYIMGPRLAADWWTVRADLRDTLDYLANSDQDIQAPANRIINLQKPDCRVIYGSLFALATEDKTSFVRRAVAPFNPFEAAVATDPELKANPLKLQALLDRQDCEDLTALGTELNFHGLLSRFQAYQTHIILLSSHDDGLSDPAIKARSRRYALLTDVERTIQEARQRAQSAGITIKPGTSPVPQQLVDYVSNLVKEN